MHRCLVPIKQPSVSSSSDHGVHKLQLPQLPLQKHVRLLPPQSPKICTADNRSSCSICSGLCRTERAASRRRCSLRVHSQSSRNATEITSQHRKPLKRCVGIIDTSVWIMKRCFCFFVNPAEAFRSSSNLQPVHAD